MSKPLKGVFWLIEGNILAVPYDEKFHLSEERPRVIYDHSRHYKCHLDAGWNRNECLNKGLQMFQEWFWDLWG